MGRVLAGVSAWRVLALYAVIAVGLPVLFWVVREVPGGYSCAEYDSPRHTARVEAFEAGAVALHAGAAALLLAALWLWSARCRGGVPGWPTLVAVPICAAFLALSVADHEAYEPYGVYAYLAAIPLVPLAAVALVLAGVTAWLNPERRGAIVPVAVAAAGWVLLLLVLPFHLGHIEIQGDHPWGCFE
jgi:hypothetical protein